VTRPARAQDLDEFGSLPDDLAGSAKRWQEWMELERPEEDVLPGAPRSRSGPALAA
jgi:hypothetical protein